MLMPSALHQDASSPSDSAGHSNYLPYYDFNSRAKQKFPDEFCQSSDTSDVRSPLSVPTIIFTLKLTAKAIKTKEVCKEQMAPNIRTLISPDPLKFCTKHIEQHLTGNGRTLAEAHKPKGRKSLQGWDGGEGG